MSCRVWVLSLFLGAYIQTISAYVCSVYATRFMAVHVAPNVGMCDGVVGQGCCMGMIVQHLMCGYVWVWLVVVWVLVGSLVV